MRYIFCVCFLFFVGLSYTIEVDPFLLVVGDISTSHIRVLHELVDSSSSNYFSCLFKDGESLPMTCNEWNTMKKPQIIEYSSLESSSEYKSCFSTKKIQTIDDCSSFIKVRTFKTNENQLNFTVVSCNRYIEDRDSYMWTKLQQSHDNQEIHSGTFHVGDQIYADKIPSQFISQYSKDENTCIPFLKLVNHFRSYYRDTWNHPAMYSTLRLGPNWMIPDDHELMNNANPEFWNLTVSPRPIHLTTDVVKFFMRAGFQSFLEYQYSLYQNPPNLPNVDQCCVLGSNEDDNCDNIWKEYDDTIIDFLKFKGLNIFKRIGNTEIIMLDTRYERTLLDENSKSENHPWLGDDQYQRFNSKMDTISNDNTIDNILIFTGMPVYFASNSMARLAYSVEGEKYASHPDLDIDLKHFLSKLFDSNNWNKISLISGDLHMYFEGYICDSYSSKCISQVISSGMTIGSTSLHNSATYLYYIITFGLTRPYLFTDNYTFTTKYDSIFLANNYLILDINNDNIIYRSYWRPLITKKDILLHWIFDNNYWILVTFLITIPTLVILLCLKKRTNRNSNKKKLN